MSKLVHSCSLIGIGQVYDFTPALYYKGARDLEGAQTLHIVQLEGRINHLTSEKPSSSDIEAARAMEKYIPFKTGDEVILFLEPLKGFPDLKMYYTAVAQPWRFSVSNGCAIPISPWYGAGQYFQPLPVEDFTKQIEMAVAGLPIEPGTLSYPVPVVSGSTDCPNDLNNASPYP